jgi:hypothetical protein
MRRDMFLGFLALLWLLFATLLGGCGSAKKGGESQPLAQPTQVGSESCVNTCHALTVDVTGDVIAASWSSPLNTHTTDGNVQCENCHGGASQHWGVGPIPFPDPQPAQCEVCHPDFVTFNTTAHNNENQVPDKNFSEFFPGAGTTTVSQHIAECSVCHNSSQRFVFNSSGVLTMPDPNNLPNPVVTCASCHDAHFAESKQVIPQESAAVPYPNFRFYFQNISGSQVNPEAQVPAGTPKSARQNGFVFQPNGVAIGGTLNGTNNEIKPELVCAACHTKGIYLYTQTATHQRSVYTQWTNSAHGTRADPAWGEFSANPTVYNPTFATGPGSHQTTYPVDMAFNHFSSSASAGINAGNNNFACFKCHNGISSIDYQENVQGTPDAGIVWGDATATCITCHDPHANSTGLTSNIRRPVKMTKYSFSRAPAAFTNFSGNVFLDRNPVPAQAENATSVICIFCHQGRESGYTLFGTKLSTGTVPSGSFFNNHYLGTAAMLWGFNGYEFLIGGIPQTYSVNAAHQSTNCAGCHMNKPTSDNTVAGHTWLVNPNNCTACHSTIVNPPVTADNLADPNAAPLATTRVTDDQNNYTGDSDGATISISTTIMRLEQKLIGLLASQTPTGIFYDDTTYPYFFNVNITVPDGTANNHSNSNATSTWNEAQLKAAFNLSYVIKGLPSAGGSTTYATIPGTTVRVPDTSSALVPNNSAAVHNYKYNIQLLQDSIATLSGQGANVYQPGGLLAGAVRPSTNNDRPATSYNPSGIDQPYPNFQ